MSSRLPESFPPILEQGTDVPGVVHLSEDSKWKVHVNPIVCCYLRVCVWRDLPPDSIDLLVRPPGHDIPNTSRNEDLLVIQVNQVSTETPLSREGCRGPTWRGGGGTHRWVPTSFLGMDPVPSYVGWEETRCSRHQWRVCFSGLGRGSVSQTHLIERGGMGVGRSREKESVTDWQKTVA